MLRVEWEHYILIDDTKKSGVRKCRIAQWYQEWLDDIHNEFGDWVLPEEALSVFPKGKKKVVPEPEPEFDGSNWDGYHFKG